jgi:hypothetical protein
LAATRRIPLMAIAVAIAGLTLASCESNRKGSAEGQARQMGGPLQVNGSDGGVGVTALDGPRWSVTFGVTLLCNNSASQIEIVRVRPHVRVAAKGISFAVRRADAETRVGPFVANVGRPETLIGTLFDGDLVPNVRDAVIEECGDAPRPFTELLATIKTDRGGAWVDQLEVDYLSDGEPYTVRVEWDFVICGTAIGGKAGCKS